jgi:glyoxylase-like metal-dependent hydrolase (beta-lactamase superfamily II)
MNEAFFFRQFLAGRDFAVGDDVATAMRNFSYAIGDRDRGDVVLVDPAYRPEELVAMMAAEAMRVVGIVATHYHPDHVGGSIGANVHIDGVAELLRELDLPIHVQADEVSWISASTKVPPTAFVAHHDRDVLAVGDVEVTLLHTPGHTPGSQCLLVGGDLLSGDTLFIDGCGRTDLPGGDARALYASLHERLAHIDDETMVYPGHLYSPEGSLSMGEVRARNYVLEDRSAEQWLAMFGS